MTTTAWDTDRFAADRRDVRDALYHYNVTYGATDDGKPFKALRRSLEANLDIDLNPLTLAQCIHLEAAHAAVDTDGIDGMTHRHPEYDDIKEALRFSIADSLDAAIRRLIGDHYLVRSSK